ncbi:TetR/AcrR family transcriptional regulator [Streptomyces griseus]|uniref:TetR/AcrR family transcriptional regulator n=1 Tax=Streptomyces griseus TaxID=1911 RepID=UPI003829B40B
MVKETSAGGRYHHGNLRAALLDSALVVLTEKGVAGFSMREAARRAGVSQSAPKYHFGDTRGLLGALATSAYRRLCDRLEGLDLTGLPVRERVERVAAQYVSFAGENRALFDLMWRMTQFDFTAPELAEQKHRALRALDRALRGENAEPADDADPALIPSYAVWSLVHGYATLALEGAIDSGNPDPLNSDLLPAMLALLAVRDLP